MQGVVRYGGIDGEGDGECFACLCYYDMYTLILDVLFKEGTAYRMQMPINVGYEPVKREHFAGESSKKPSYRSILIQLLSQNTCFQS